MRNFEGIYDAKGAVLDYLTGKHKLDPDTCETIKKALNQASPVDAIVQSAEALYAARDKLDNEGRDVVAGAMAFLAQQDLHGYASNGRAHGVTLAMLRDNGEKPTGGAKFPKAADDPAPIERPAPAPAPEAVPAP